MIFLLALYQLSALFRYRPIYISLFSAHSFSKKMDQINDAMLGAKSADEFLRTFKPFRHLLVHDVATVMERAAETPESKKARELFDEFRFMITRLGLTVGATKRQLSLRHLHAMYNGYTAHFVSPANPPPPMALDEFFTLLLAWQNMCAVRVNSDWLTNVAMGHGVQNAVHVMNCMRLSMSTNEEWEAFKEEFGVMF